MNKIGKLIGIILILYFVFFIICDEKGIQIGWENNHIVLNKIEKKSELVNNKNVVYKNSNLIHINPEFENPKTLYKSNGVNLEYIAKLKEDKKYEEKLAKARGKNDETSQSKNNTSSDVDSITSLFENDKSQVGIEEIPQTGNDTVTNKHDDVLIEPKTTKYNTRNNVGDDISVEVEKGVNIPETGKVSENDPQERVIVYYPVNKYNFTKHDLKLNKGVTQDISSENQQDISINDFEKNSAVLSQPNINEIINNEDNIPDPTIDNKKSLEESSLVKINKYQFNRHNITLRNGKRVRHNFVVNNESTEQSGNRLSNDMLDGLLENEEIDIDTLESENDEFLQKVFQQTRDIEIMNLIVENYLNEYQFIKAKRFIENLPKEYINQLKPTLYLRVAFNSFALSSKNINENLTSIVQDYTSKNQISTEDSNRYLGVLALMNQNYDRFFEISLRFTSDNHKSFTNKIQGYKTQISKQMGMPEYYFDTLVSLELFNQGLFQPAKVLSLYSLQKNPNYILPYQILAYANFLTNSRDTSIEYLKKLVDLDPNNAEKYRFLMGVANYRNEKYGQSAIMLAMIKSDNLRLDAERYLIRDYLFLKQNNKLISSWNKLLGYENLVASDFYTYFYEAFFHPYAEGQDFKIYLEDTELANKMLRVCSMRLPDDEKVVCMYGSIGKNIAIGKFNGLEQSLLKLVAEYPQGYLYHALGEYYIKQGDLEKAKAYLLKAVSATQKTSEKNQIKKLLEDTM